MSLTSLTRQLLESVPEAPGKTDAPAWFTLYGELEDVLHELPGAWVDATAAADRRVEQRFHCDHPAWLRPLDGEHPLDEAPAIAVRVQDISRHGIGLAHGEPLAHRLVLISFDSDGLNSPELVVRLQWCRFRGPGAYESGGQIQRIVDASVDFRRTDR
ncbi:MAG: hypothetical protein ACT4QC_17800 [Planctomycetaceae bacterium]